MNITTAERWNYYAWPGIRLIACRSIETSSSSCFSRWRSSTSPRTNRREPFTPLFACCGTILLARCKRINPNSDVSLTLRLSCRPYRLAAVKLTALSGTSVAAETHESAILLRDRDTSLSRGRFCFPDRERMQSVESCVQRRAVHIPRVFHVQFPNKSSRTCWKHTRVQTFFIKKYNATHVHAYACTWYISWVQYFVSL